MEDDNSDTDIFNELNSLDNEISTFFDTIESKKKEIKEFHLNSNYNKYQKPKLTTEEKLKHYIENLSESELMRLKDTNYKENIDENDVNKIILRLEKKNGKLHNYAKIMEVDGNIIYLKNKKGNGMLRKIYANKYYIFLLKYNTFRDYLESFIK